MELHPIDRPGAKSDCYTTRMLGGLVGSLATLSSRDDDEITRLAETLLAHPPVDRTQWCGRSDLNGNASPIQVLLSAKTDGWEARLIADPAFYHADPLKRWQGSLSALAGALASGRATALHEMVEQTLAAIVPPNVAARRTYPTGMIRIAVSLSSPGVAVYTSPTPAADRWNVVRRWVEKTFSDPAPALHIIANLETVGTVFGVGLEGVSPARARAKIYWRLRDAKPLAAFGIQMFESKAVLSFLRAVMRARDFPPAALTFSAGFEPARGALTDIKVDVCNTAAGLDLAEGLALANEQARALSLVLPPCHCAQARFADHGMAIGCLGIGLDRNGAHRLNIYLHQQ
jgi:hypothetical protein